MLDISKINEIDIQEWEREIVNYNLINNDIDNLKKIDPFIRYQLEIVGNYLLDLSYRVESDITKNLLEIIDDKSYFVELENRIKGKKRLLEKIYKKSLDKNIDIMTAGNMINDIIRYTLIIDEDNYINTIDKYLHKLEKNNYEVIKFKNRWQGDYCRGIIVQFISNEGYKFEIQFHTPMSYSIKENASREPYKLSRNIHAPTDLLAKANILRLYYQRKVPFPKDVLNYNFVSDIKTKKK